MLDSQLIPTCQGRLREESWGGLHYIRDLTCINLVNDVAHFALSRCDGVNTIAEIEALVEAAFDAPPEQIRSDLHSYLLYCARYGYVTVPGRTRADFGEPNATEDAATESAMLGRLGVIGLGQYALSAPLKVLIETTHNCNLRCVHCFANAAYELEAPDGYLPGELTGDEWCRVIDNVAKANVFDLFVSGGEPLARRDIFDILAHVKSRGMGFCLLSNLTLLDDEAAFRLKELDCYKIEGNMDGPDAESYDAFRGVPGAFDLTLRGIRACQKAGIGIRLNVTATKLNIFRLKEIVRTVADLGITELAAVPLERGGRAREDWEKLSFTIDEQVRLTEHYKEVSAWIAATYGSDFCFVGPTDFVLDNRDNRIVDLVDPNRILPLCGAGKFHCSIAPNGRVILCPTAGQMIPITPGDALREDFGHIWRTADVFHTLRNIDIPVCRSCEYQNCGGGCQVNAYLKYGKIGVHPDTDCRKVYYASMKKAGFVDVVGS